MKVLHVFKDYYPPTFGGIEQHINDVVHSIPEIRFGVLTSSRTRRLIRDDDYGVNVVRAPEYLRPVSTPITPSWSGLLRNSGTDLFHFHVPNPFGELMFLTSRAKAPMVATYHADIIGRKALLPFFKPFQNRFLRRAERIIVSNPRLAETCIPLKGLEQKCVVIPFGLDPRKYSQKPPEADEMRAVHGTPIVLFVGRLAYYKGLEVLIRAMKSVEATCLIVGSGPLQKYLEELAADSGLEEKVHFLGDISEVRKIALLHSADLFVLPSTSRAEAFGISMLEAMACGVPAISTELGTGTSWVNKNRSTGLVVEAGDDRALSGAINVLLGDDRRRRAMGAAAQSRVRENFSRDKMLESLASLYRSFQPAS